MSNYIAPDALASKSSELLEFAEFCLLVAKTKTISNCASILAIHITFVDLNPKHDSY